MARELVIGPPIRKIPENIAKLFKKNKGMSVAQSVVLLQDMGYSDTEVSEIFGVPLTDIENIKDTSWAKKLVDDRNFENRTKEIARRLLNLSDFRMKILADLTATSGMPLPYLREMREEEHHRISTLQSLGELPKESQKVEVSGGLLETAVFLLSKSSKEIPPMLLPPPVEKVIDTQPSGGVYYEKEEEKGIPLEALDKEEPEE